MIALENEERKVLLFEILKDFKNFCVQHELTYSLFGGTLLGAIRHGGFIPWDDDVDVAMPRLDYEAFIKLFEGSVLAKKYKLYNSNVYPDYPYPFLKLANPKTLIQGCGKDSRFEMGLHIDIFPLDGFPRRKWLATLQFRFHFLLRQLSVLSSLHVYVKKRSVFKVCFLLFYKVCTLGVKPRFWHCISNYVAKRHKICSSFWAGNCVWGVGIQEVLPACIFMKRKDVFFEKEKFSSFEDADAYLSGIYGDYMTPPPVEQRIGGHLLGAYMKED